MSFGRSYPHQGGTMYQRYSTSFPRNANNGYDYQRSIYGNHDRYDLCDYKIFDDMNGRNGNYNVTRNYPREKRGFGDSPSVKRRRFSENTWGNGGYYCQSNGFGVARFDAFNGTTLASIGVENTASVCSGGKRGRSCLDEEEEVALMSREEIERCSPSRKDGIDALHEAQLRYSYCAFLRNLGMRLDLPQTTVGTAMVLCHRFFVRRSHACHDRFLIATAALFLAAKSEETARPLNDVVKASCEIIHKQSLTILSYILPIDWFEQYRERITEAEQLILTTLNFELSVQHPYDPLTSILNKLGLSQTLLVDLALNLVSEGLLCTDIPPLSVSGSLAKARLRSSLWLQFKPHQIAAGIAYVSAKLLNLNLDSYLSVWREFQSPPAVLQDVEKQLMELF